MTTLQHFPVRALLLAALLLWACDDRPTSDQRMRLRGSDELGATFPGEADSPARLRALADEAYAGAEYDDAQAYYARALAAAGLQGDSTFVSVVLTALGNTARQLGDYPAARRHGESALALKQRLSLREHLFDSYNALGLLAWEEDRLQDARQLFTHALEFTRGPLDTARAKVAANLGLVLTDFGEFAEARRLFHEAAAVARKAANPRIEGRALNNLAALEIQVGRPVTAMTHLTRAGPLLVRAKDRRGEVNWLGQMGTGATALGELGRGIAWLDSALARSREVELPYEEATNLEQLADLHRLAGDERRALDLLAQARALNERLDRTVYAGIDLRREAEIDASLGDTHTALRKARQALGVHRRAAARFEELADLLLLAELSAEAGLPADARTHLTAARTVADALEASTARVGYALVEARLAENAGRHREALRALDRVAEDLALAGHEATWQAELIRSRAQVGVGNLQAAAEAGRRALDAVEHVRGSFASGLLRTSYQARRDEVYARQVDVLLRLGHVEEAFEVADAGRGRALLEHLAAASPIGRERQPVPTIRELAEEERKLLARADSVSVAINQLDPEGNTDRAEFVAERVRLSRELERTRSTYEATLIRAEEHSGARRALVGGRVPAEAIRAALAPDEALLEYLVTPARIVLFVVRADTMVSLAVDVSRPNLLTKVRVARELTGRVPRRDRNTAEASGAGALTELFGLLLQPALDHGALEGIHRLVVVPHAELQYLPFSALKNPKSGRYLIEDFTVVHLPSSAALPTLRARASERTPRSGSVAFAPLPDRLPGTVREVSAFQRALERSRTRRGKRATEAALREALTKNDVVHVATHGALSVVNPMFSRMEMARGSDRGSEDDGRLEVHEVLGLSAVSRLVFLSGCETGSGGAWSTAFDPGEDYATLARSFLYAGVHNVVATLWRIEDDGAAAFAAEFYRALGSRPPAEALADAQRAMISQGKYSAPFYWAGYRLDGSG